MMNIKRKIVLTSCAALSLMVAHATPATGQELSEQKPQQELSEQKPQQELSEQKPQQGLSEQKPQQELSATANSAQPQIDQDVSKKAKEQRDKIVADAVTALSETKKALELLAEKKTEEALSALEKATGKLELILARDPQLALVPVDTRVVIHDQYLEPDTVNKTVKQVRELLDNGEIQKARPLLAGLSSDVVYETHNLPLITYPPAIKSAARLIDEGKTEEAKAMLQSALNTLVLIADAVIPLPIARAEHLLKKAENLTENDKRDDKQNEELVKLLAEVRKQIQLAEALGYGKQGDFESIYGQVKQIEEKTTGGKSGKGWFDTIKEQVSSLF